MQENEKSSLQGQAFLPFLQGKQLKPDFATETPFPASLTSYSKLSVFHSYLWQYIPIKSCRNNCHISVCTGFSQNTFDGSVS